MTGDLGAVGNEERLRRARLAVSHALQNADGEIGDLISEALVEIDAALAATPVPGAAREHEPGESHRYRIECEVCGQRGLVQLSVEPQRAALSAVTPAAPLDVERLAVAMNAAQIDAAEIRLGKDLMVPARRVAARYARLSAAVPDSSGFDPATALHVRRMHEAASPAPEPQPPGETS